MRPSVGARGLLSFGSAARWVATLQFHPPPFRHALYPAEEDHPVRRERHPLGRLSHRFLLDRRWQIRRLAEPVLARVAAQAELRGAAPALEFRAAAAVERPVIRPAGAACAAGQAEGIAKVLKRSVLPTCLGSLTLLEK